MIMIKKDRLIWGSVLGVIGMLIIIFYGFLLMPLKENGNKDGLAHGQKLLL